MAFQLATYKPSDALTEVKAMIKSMPIDTADGGELQHKLVDQVCSLVWSAAPWWWTLGTMANVTVVAGQQDYAITVPDDFLYLARAVVTTADNQTDLEVVSILPSAITQTGVPSQAAVVAKVAYPTPDTLRISPKPPPGYAATANLTYKRQPPKITASNFGTAGAMVLPDIWYPVIKAGCLWKGYQYGDDNRAGTATTNSKGELEFTQQLGIFEALIEQMRIAEKTFLRYPGIPVSHG